MPPPAVGKGLPGARLGWARGAGDVPAGACAPRPLLGGEAVRVGIRVCLAVLPHPFQLRATPTRRSPFPTDQAGHGELPAAEGD